MAFKRTAAFIKRDYVSALWVKQVGQALAKKFKVSVRKGKNWSADVTKGVLTYGPEIHMLTHQQALGLLSHEIGHLRYTKHPKETETNKQFPELSHQAVNMLEDHRIEHLMSQDFAGAREAIGLMRSHLNKKCANDLAETGRKLKSSYDRVVDYSMDRGLTPPQSLAEMQRIAVKEGNLTEEEETMQHLIRQQDEANVPLATQVLLVAHLMHFGEFETEDYPDPEIHAKARKIADKMAEGNIEQMPDTQTISDFFHDEIYPIVGEYFTANQEQKARRSKVKAGTEESEVRKSMYDAPTKSDEMRQLIEDLHEQQTGERPSLGKGDGGNRNKYLEFNYDVTRALIQAEVGTAVHKLKRILKDRMFDRYSGRFLTGRLNQRKLYRHRMGDMRLFERKVVDDSRDFAFMLNVDVSASMRERGRMINAQKAVVLLLEVLTEVDVPTGLVTFGERVNTVKGLTDTLDKKRITKGLTELERNTLLVEGTKESAKQLLGNEAVNKVHITITDGNVYPSDVRTMMDLQRKHKGIKFYGIGVQTDLREMYPDDHKFNLKDTEMLMPTLLEILKSHIR